MKSPCPTPKCGKASIATNNTSSKKDLKHDFLILSENSKSQCWKTNIAFSSILPVPNNKPRATNLEQGYDPFSSSVSYTFSNAIV